MLVSGSDTGAVQLFTYPLRQGPINFFIINIEGALRRPLTYDDHPIHPIPSLPLLGRYPDTKLLFFLICPNYLPQPPPPNLENLYDFFRRLNSRFESRFRTKNTILYDIIYIYNFKKSLRLKLLAFWRK